MERRGRRTAPAEQFGRVSGFFTGYLMFTAIAYLTLSRSGAIPSAWTPLHVAPFSGAIAAFGAGLRRLLR